MYCEPMPVSRMHIAGVMPVAIEEVGAGVELAGTVARGRRDRALGSDLRGRVEELVATHEERTAPFRARVVGEAFLGSCSKGDGARGGVADRDRVFKDLAHAVVGLERLAVNDADRSKQTHQLRIARSRWFLLHQLVHQLPVREVIREDRVERLA
jgi:hypothetical protein